MRSLICRGVPASALAMALLGCNDGATAPGKADLDVAPILWDVANHVILPTYLDLAARADDLAQAVDALTASPSQENLDAATAAWKAARRPWEQSEAFLFGPVETEDIDPAIDTWPLNKVDLDGVLSGNGALTKEYVDNLEPTLKGFHTLEYLLFGADAGKQAPELTARELEYLAAAAQSFQAATHRLATAWDPAGGNFLAAFVKAGDGSALYATRRDALQELLNGMAGICGEVSDSKIAAPFESGDRSREESAFSGNSDSDLVDNIRSAQNVYLGRYGTDSAQGVGVFVAAEDPVLDARVKRELREAIDRIRQMSPAFGAAITSNRPSVEAARAAVSKVMTTLTDDVLPLLGD
jgi:putative iron-regulated protein